MILKFGKYKGEKFQDTPISYQNWLMKQDWFNKPKTVKKAIPLHKQLNGWDGYSRKGEAVYNAIFEQEKAEWNAYDKRQGWYEEDGMYFGM